MDLLTLGGLSFQINLYIKVLNLSILLLSMYVTDARNVMLGKIRDFTTVIFPIIVRFLLVQLFNNFSDLSYCLSKFSFLHSPAFLPKYIPKLLTGISVQFMFSNFSLQCLRAPSQIPSVLDRFNFNPESAPKISIRFKALVISCLVLRNRVVSSAS